MTQPRHQPGDPAHRYPLSDPQQLWCAGDLGDDAGFFSSRFTMVSASRITGQVDLGALQGALDAVVERHEILRTVLVRDAEPPYQQLHPARPVELVVRDRTPEPGESREACAERLLTEAARTTVDPGLVPLLRATLDIFDGGDSVLTLLTHHTACDEWSFSVIRRDLAACYAARATGSGPALPAAAQYRDFVAWQRAGATGPAAAAARVYWRQRMAGAHIFAIPTDRVVPQARAFSCSANNFTVQ
jgi:hypothetical protein